MGARSWGPELFGMLILKGYYPLFKDGPARYLGVPGKNFSLLNFLMINNFNRAVDTRNHGLFDYL